MKLSEFKPQWLEFLDKTDQHLNTVFDDQQKIGKLLDGDVDDITSPSEIIDQMFSTNQHWVDFWNYLVEYNDQLAKLANDLPLDDDLKPHLVSLNNTLTTITSLSQPWCEQLKTIESSYQHAYRHGYKLQKSVNKLANKPDPTDDPKYQQLVADMNDTLEEIFDNANTHFNMLLTMVQGYATLLPNMIYSFYLELLNFDIVSFTTLEQQWLFDYHYLGNIKMSKHFLRENCAKLHQ